MARRSTRAGPRIAVFADVHGNLPALEAVLEDIEAQQIDEVLVGGDLVGRGPQGSAVVHRIAERELPSVKGNHEDYLLSFRHGDVPEAWLSAEEWAASRWMAAELTDEAVERIAALPFTLASELTPQLRLVHGTPRSNNEGVGPWSSEEQVARHLGSVAEPVLVCAHTHRPLERRFPDGLVVNVGSVGLPFNRDRRAQYAILELRGREWEVEFRRVDYPLARTLAIYEESGFLAEGGITARLLELELCHAVPYLVPFMKWAEVMERPPVLEALDDFLDFYDPEQPMRAFFERLHGVG